MTGVELTSRLDFKIVIAIIIAVGIFLRFFHLGFQDYWHDEAITSLYIAGHTKSEAADFLMKQPRQFGELVAYCEPLRNGFSTVWNCWTTGQPAKAPLFFILEYYWTCAFGNAVVTMRLLPALLSLLQLPAFYWFGIELFRSRTTAWLMVALVAISPVAVLYSQEARDYSLYTAMIAFVCAAFLKAVNTPSRRNWLLYVFTLTVSLYTSFLIVLSLAAQFAFLIVRRQFKQLREFILSMLGAAVFFSPWLSLNLPYFIHGYPDHGCLQAKLDSLTWFNRLLCTLWMPIFYPGEHSFFPEVQGRQKIMGMGAVLYSFYRLVKVISYPGPLFLASLLVVGSAPFITLDLATGRGVRATIIRYMIHVHVVVIASIAYAFSSHCDFKGSWKKGLIWWCAFVVFCLFMIDSTLSLTTTHTSFLKIVTDHQRLRPLADRINSTAHPATVVSAITGLTNHMQMFALCRQVKPETRLIFMSELTLKDMPDDVDQFFLFGPTPEFVEILQKSGYDMKPIPKSRELWQVRRTNR